MEEKDLERLLKLTEENNKMLRRIRRDQKISLITRIIYWLIVLGVIYGVYYFLQPYFNSFNQNIQNFQNTIRNISSSTNNLPKNLPEFSKIKQFLENLKNWSR